MDGPKTNIQASTKRRVSGTCELPSKKHSKTPESWSDPHSTTLKDDPLPLMLQSVQGMSNAFNKFQVTNEMKKQLTDNRKAVLDQVRNANKSPNGTNEVVGSLLGDTSPSESVEAFMDLQRETLAIDVNINNNADELCPEASPLSIRGSDWADQSQASHEKALPLDVRPFHPVEPDGLQSVDSLDDDSFKDDTHLFPERRRAMVQIPGHVVGGQMIDTHKGLALLVPSDKMVQTPQGLAVLVLQPDNSSTDKVSVGNVADQGGCRDGKHWNPSEDTILKHAVLTQGSLIDWKTISDRFFAGSRSSNSCKQRWRKIDPSCNTAAFNENENNIIIQERLLGKSWSDIAKCLVNRTANQVKFHFEKIDPTRKKGKWSAAEDEFLIAAQSRLGNKWAKISEFLPGRSSNDVKNRWSRLRRHSDSLQSTT